MTSPTAAFAQAQEWFNLVRYEVMGSFTADQWIDQVAKRSVISQALLSNNQNHLDHLLPDLIDAPVSDWPFRYRNTDGTASRSCEPVTPLGERQLQFLSAHAPSGIDPGDLADQRWIGDDHLLSMSRFGHVRVDMNASDADILNAFSQWLRTYRQISTPGVRMKSPSVNLLSETNDWHRRGLFPYFDLVAWSAWSKAALTERDLLTLLFPHDQDPSRVVLRTLARQCKEVFTMPNVLRLQLRFQQPES